MVKAQDWLTNNYESKKNDITEIRISKGTELEGEVTIDGYPQLKGIYLGGTKKDKEDKGITELKIDNCPNVETLFVSDNQITKIEGLEKLVKLRKLSFGGNKIEKIDISKNTELEMLYFRNNPANLEFTNGLKGLSKLISWDSYETFPLTKILNEANEAELKDIAKELGLTAEGTPEEIKNAIKNEIEKNKDNKEKLDKDFPDLFGSDGKIDDNKLGEIKDNIGKGNKYQALVDKDANASIVDPSKKEIDQSKLTDVLEELKQLHDVANHQGNEKILDNGKFSQTKLDAELAKGDDYNELVKSNPNLVTDGKIDPAKIKDLSDKGGKFKDLEDTMKKAGIDPSNADEAKKRIAKLSVLEARVKEFFGDKYEERLEVQEYQSYIEVNTNNKN